MLSDLMKWVVGAFLILAVVTTGAFFTTEPVVEVEKDVVVEQGDEAELGMEVRNVGTVHVSVVGEDSNGTAPRVRLPGDPSTTSATAAVPAAGEVEPRLTVEAPEDVEPGEYRMVLEAWRLPDRTGYKTVHEVEVVVEKAD